MGRPRIGERAMTSTERAFRHRAKANTNPLPALHRAASALERAARLIRETIKLLEADQDR